MLTFSIRTKTSSTLAGDVTAPISSPTGHPELLYGQNFISHLGVYRTSLVRALNGFRLGFEGSQDYDLALRATAVTKGPVVHVPHVLYHWRVYPGAGTFSSTQSDAPSMPRDAPSRNSSRVSASRRASGTLASIVIAYFARARRHGLA